MTEVIQHHPRSARVDDVTHAEVSHSIQKGENIGARFLRTHHHNSSVQITSMSS